MRPTRGLLPALLHRLIVLAGAPTRIGRLGVPIALEKEAEAEVNCLLADRTLCEKRVNSPRDFRVVSKK